MPNNIIKDLAHTSLAVCNTGETVFAGIEVQKQQNSIEIYSLTFGTLFTALADKTNSIGQYVAILKNANVTNDTSALVSFPLFQNTGGEVIWFASLQGFDGNNHIDFGDKPLVLQGGNSYFVFCCCANVNGGASATMYVHVTLNASALDVNDKNIGWKLR